jgi:hypothetical protein
MRWPNDHDSPRKLDRPSDGDEQAVRAVLSLQPRIDLIATWETPAIRYPLPLAQDAPDQPSLFPHLCLVKLRSGIHWQRIG